MELLGSRDGAILELRVKLASPHDKHSIMAYLLRVRLIHNPTGRPPDRRTVLSSNAVQLSALLLRHAAARNRPSHGTLYIVHFRGWLEALQRSSKDSTESPTSKISTS